MKQLILPFKTGKPYLEDVPAPVVQPGEVLIQTRASVVSTGTERMLIEFGKAGWIGKARQQPERLKQVLEKISTDGIAPTLKAVSSKLDAPVPLGYSQCGTVIGVGTGITDIRIGDRVASNGPHAAVVSVPRNLVAKVPEEVSDEAAAFTVLGAIALQGIRLAAPTFGETIVVMGLGLIGQLTAQLLLANGCRVIGVEPHGARLRKAEAMGIIAMENASGESVSELTAGHGADAVIITASGGDGLITQAADLCRKRGRIVLTGVTDMQLSREQFFKKELTFQVSTSYGPGRYEPGYETHGLDYPIGFVRWTERRNFEAVLSAMASGKLDVASLITVRKPLQDFEALYEALESPEHLAGLIIYDSSDTHPAKTVAYNHDHKPATGAGFGLIGAGAFATGTLMPALIAAGARVSTVMSRNGLSATTLCKKFGIPLAATDASAVIQDNQISAVVIATRHDTHAALAAEALLAGKHVLVEKPLALSRNEVVAVQHALAGSAASLTVGFNRRFAPFSIRAKELLGAVASPLNIVITVNAGALAHTHWLQDAAIGGGRILGEACHFIDLCAFFANSAITDVCAVAADGASGIPPENVSILLRFTNGSTAVVNYFSNGSKAYDKERVELYGAGRTIIIENWRMLRSYGFRKDISLRRSQDKGHRSLIAAWVQAIAEGNELQIPPQQIFNSTLATIAAWESLSDAGWIRV